MWVWLYKDVLDEAANVSISIYNRNVCPFVCPSCLEDIGGGDLDGGLEGGMGGNEEGRFLGIRLEGMAVEMGRVDWKEGGNGEGEFLHVWRGWRGRLGGWTQRGRVGGKGEGDFTDGMPRWRYFSWAMPGHPASDFIQSKGRFCCHSKLLNCSNERISVWFAERMWQEKVSPQALLLRQSIYGL